MERGFTLLEFFVASLLFMAVILGGYECMDQQNAWFKHVVKITRSEAELNYRMLLVRTTLNESTRLQQRDPLLGAAPAVFADLDFNHSPGSDSFSVARVIGAPLRFTLESGWLRVFGTSGIKTGDIVLVAGPDQNSAYSYDYRRVEEVTVNGTDNYLLCTSLSHSGSPVSGSLVQVEINGLAYQDGYLYWAQPSGELSPFVRADAFQSQWNGSAVNIDWQSGAAHFSFQVRP